jgi:obg-like ATPase 1
LYLIIFRTHPTDPEESRVAVPDTRFDWLCEHFKPASKVPAYLTVIDIAGLVKGAAGGAGLGNAFLSHIRAVDGIFHVVRILSYLYLYLYITSSVSIS